MCEACKWNFCLNNNNCVCTFFKFSFYFYLQFVYTCHAQVFLTWLRHKCATERARERETRTVTETDSGNERA